MTKKEALTMIKKELNERPRFHMYENNFNFDKKWITVAGYVERKNENCEADLIIEHNGHKIISSFIEYL